MQATLHHQSVKILRPTKILLLTGGNFMFQLLLKKSLDLFELQKS